MIVCVGVVDNNIVCYNDFDLPVFPELGSTFDFGNVDLPLCRVTDVCFRPYNRMRVVVFVTPLPYEDGITKDLTPGALYEYLVGTKRWRNKI